MNQRGSGILLPISSLPSPFGIGDLGPWAYRFADFLARAKQKYWQILPLNPTDPISGNSPYSSLSAFAGNPLFISPEILTQSGFLDSAGEVCPCAWPPNRCDYPATISYKQRLLHLAYERFQSTGRERPAFEEFCRHNEAWLQDFALFEVIKKQHQGKAWGEWETDLRDRHPGSLKEIADHFPGELEERKFFQYLFFKQWFLLKTYCRQKGLRFIGDLPIYVNYDSADVWTHTEFFKLGERKTPAFMAGVPPDYFSPTGQLWGNPIYRWEVLQETGFRWWFRRIAHNLGLFDLLRLDHFRGFVAYWEVPAGETTAIGGRWVQGPGADFFAALLREFPGIALVAEDLGVITPDVREVMARFGFPGMRVLLFAFDEDSPAHPYLPHNYIPNCVAYTGTHDNNTVRGWLENEASSQARQRLFRYLGAEVAPPEVPCKLIRLLLMSAADTVIIPMQDLLGLGQEARMNRPSLAHGNWEWRLLPDQLSSSPGELLLELTCLHGRA